MTKHFPLRTVRFSSCTLTATLLLCASPVLAQTEAAEPAPAAGAETPAAEVAPAPEATAPVAAEPPVEAAAPATEAPAAEAPAPAEPEAAPPADAPKPPPYSIPFQLRPAAAVTVVRSDTAFAFYENPANGNKGSTIATTLLASYKVTDEISPLVRLGVVSNSPPDANPQPEDGFSFMNPAVGGVYAPKIGPNYKLAFFLGATIPVGSGGGNDPDPGNALANTAGIFASSAMDNAMFAVNDFTIFPGVDFAYVNHGFTAQVEATVLQLMRVRGEDVQKDEAKTNFTSGLHLGYFVVPMLSLAGELRYQRWLSTPKAVEADEALDEPLGLRDNMTVAFGPRFHFKIGEKTWIRPAVAFAVPLDDPMQDRKYKILQLDVPVIF
jgi:hypothetical protein